MKKEQFKQLTDVSKIESVISINDLIDKSPRTLLYGYTCERETHHVYIDNDRIITVRYWYGEEPEEMKIYQNEGYVPDKRLYPECCDYEFCKLLKERDVYLCFTTWNDTRPSKQYHGNIII